MRWNSIVYVCRQPMIATPSDLQNLKKWRLRDYKFEKADKKPNTYNDAHEKSAPICVAHVKTKQNHQSDERNEKIYCIYVRKQNKCCR